MTIKAWETENGTLIVWGTHNPADALPAALTYYREEVGEIPEGLDEALLQNEGHPFWAEAKNITVEEQWPSDSYGPDFISGRIPYLVVNW